MRISLEMMSNKYFSRQTKPKEIYYWQTYSDWDLLNDVLQAKGLYQCKLRTTKRKSLSEIKEDKVNFSLFLTSLKHKCLKKNSNNVSCDYNIRKMEIDGKKMVQR